MSGQAREGGSDVGIELDLLAAIERDSSGPRFPVRNVDEAAP